MITHLEPDILECEVKLTLGSITMNKASGGDGFPVGLLQSSKMMLWKCSTQYASKSGNLSSGYRTRKGQFSFWSQRKAMPNNVQTTTQSHSSHTLAKKWSKFFKSGFNMWTVNFQMFKMDLEKAEEPQIKWPTSAGSSKKQENWRKNIFLLYLFGQNLWLCGSHQTVENSLKDGNTRPPDLPPEKSICRSRSNS